MADTSEMKVLDETGTAYLVEKTKGIVPKKVSELENDSGYVTEMETTGSTFRITDNDTGTVYLASIEVTGGKPVLVYREISEE